LEVGAHARDSGIRIGAVDLQLDVAIELLEAFLATQLWPRWPKQPLEEAGFGWVRVLVHRFDLGSVVSQFGNVK
jgi:hypothetical protein